MDSVPYSRAHALAKAIHVSTARASPRTVSGSPKALSAARTDSKRYSAAFCSNTASKVSGVPAASLSALAILSRRAC